MCVGNLDKICLLIGFKKSQYQSLVVPVSRRRCIMSMPLCSMPCEQVKKVIQFLKATTAPHLRMMKRKVLEGQKGWKMAPIEVDNLKEQIKSILASTADEFDFETMKNNIKFN